MHVVNEQNDAQLHAVITNRNMLWQYDFMIDSVQLAINVMSPDSARVTHQFIMSLNHFAVVNLSSSAGELRCDFVHITGSDHEPPPADHVKKFLLDMIVELHSQWKNWSAIEAASYLLWRLTWIHPFEEGNGRTARAAAYFVMCAKLGSVLPGRRTVPKLIRDDPAPYYRALRHADITHAAGHTDLTPLCTLLESLLRSQLSSAIEQH